jgi:anti-sigma factor RsiW
MKSFEEKYNAWVDGLLSGDELNSFEREQRATDKQSHLAVRRLLREGMTRAVPHPDFFQRQILDQVERERTRQRIQRGRWLGIPWIAWSGMVTLGAAVALFVVMIPHGDLSDPRAGYVAEVLKTKTGKSQVTATVDNRKGMTIIKLNGLEKIPAEKDPSR